MRLYYCSFCGGYCFSNDTCPHCGRGDNLDSLDFFPYVEGYTSREKWSQGERCKFCDCTYKIYRKCAACGLENRQHYSDKEYAQIVERANLHKAIACSCSPTKAPPPGTTAWSGVPWPPGKVGPPAPPSPGAHPVPYTLRSSARDKNSFVCGLELCNLIDSVVQGIHGLPGHEPIIGEIHDRVNAYRVVTLIPILHHLCRLHYDVMSPKVQTWVNQTNAQTVRKMQVVAAMRSLGRLGKNGVWTDLGSGGGFAVRGARMANHALTCLLSSPPLTSGSEFMPKDLLLYAGGIAEAYKKNLAGGKNDHESYFSFLLKNANVIELMRDNRKPHKNRPGYLIVDSKRIPFVIEARTMADLSSFDQLVYAWVEVIKAQQGYIRMNYKDTRGKIQVLADQRRITSEDMRLHHRIRNRLWFRNILEVVNRTVKGYSVLAYARQPLGDSPPGRAALFANVFLAASKEDFSRIPDCPATVPDCPAVTVLLRRLAEFNTANRTPSGKIRAYSGVAQEVFPNVTNLQHMMLYKAGQGELGLLFPNKCARDLFLKRVYGVRANEKYVQWYTAKPKKLYLRTSVEKNRLSVLFPSPLEVNLFVKAIGNYSEWVYADMKSSCVLLLDESFCTEERFAVTVKNEYAPCVSSVFEPAHPAAVPEPAPPARPVPARPAAPPYWAAIMREVLLRGREMLKHFIDTKTRWGMSSVYSEVFQEVFPNVTNPQHMMLYKAKNGELGLIFSDNRVRNSFYRSMYGGRRADKIYVQCYGNQPNKLYLTASVEENKLFVFFPSPREVKFFLAAIGNYSEWVYVDMERSCVLLLDESFCTEERFTVTVKNVFAPYVPLVSEPAPPIPHSVTEPAPPPPPVLEGEGNGKKCVIM